MDRKEIVILSIITFLTVLVWIFFGILNARKTSTVTSVQLQQVVPLTPTFDNDIIRKLKSREDLLPSL